MRTVLLCLSLLLYAIRTIAFELSDIITLTDRNGLSQNTVRCLMVDKRNFIWLGTVNGLNRYDRKNFAIIHPYQKQTSSMADSRIREITEDRYGFIWIRTFANAVCCYNPKQERIIDYAPQNTTQTFQHIRIMSDGELWMWGKEGCCRVNYTDGMPVSQLFHTEDLSSGHILFVFEDSRQRRWIGTQKALYCVEANQTKQIREERFWDAAQSGDELYFAGEKGLTVLNAVNRTFISSIPLIPSDARKK